MKTIFTNLLHAFIDKIMAKNPKIANYIQWSAGVVVVAQWLLANMAGLGLDEKTQALITTVCGVLIAICQVVGTPSTKPVEQAKAE